MKYKKTIKLMDLGVDVYEVTTNESNHSPSAVVSPAAPSLPALLDNLQGIMSAFMKG